MDRGYIRAPFGETRFYGTANSPKGILNTIKKALEYHGVEPEKTAGVDLAKLEAQFDAIDARAFQRLLSACEFHGLQIAIVESTEKTGKHVVSSRDAGSMFGMVA